MNDMYEWEDQFQDCDSLSLNLKFQIFLRFVDIFLEAIGNHKMI